MSRVYEMEEEEFPNQAALYSMALKNALNGAKGQALLLELETALLSMPEKRLIQGRFSSKGEVCVLGCLAVHRRVKAGCNRAVALKVLEVASEEYDEGDDGAGADFAKKELQIKSKVLAQEIVWTNDNYWGLSPEKRYESVLGWVQEHIKRGA